MLSEKAEELMEHFWVELVEKQKKDLDPSLLRDDQDFKLLTDEGYIQLDGVRVTLTPRGYEEGKNCIRRHRLAERLITDLLYCGKQEAHETGCRFEHLLHKGIEENVCTLLGHPRTCPHGQPIPEGQCCKDSKRNSRQLILPLKDLPIGATATIAYLQTKDFQSMQKIIAIGALPETTVTMDQTYPSYVFKIARSQFAIDQDLASQIFVRMSEK